VAGDRQKQQGFLSACIPANATQLIHTTEPRAIITLSRIPNHHLSYYWPGSDFRWSDGLREEMNEEWVGFLQWTGGFLRNGEFD
jgi:hypothetical protein